MADDLGRKSIAEKESLAFLECLFRDRMHMVKHKNEIKFHLRSSLSEEKQAILRNLPGWQGVGAFSLFYVSTYGSDLQCNHIHIGYSRIV